MNKGKSWYFDTEAGKKEILYRRVGRNEISAITVCQELVAAQKEYYSAQHNEYAQKIFSDEGQHNGLYWKAGDGEAPSPIGPLVASAFVGSGQDQLASALSRLLLPHAMASGRWRLGWVEAIRRKWKDDGRVRFCGLSGGLQVIGRHDIYCQ